MDGHWLIASGLVLETLATLFLSVDALVSQESLVKIFDVQSYISRLDVSIEELTRDLSEGGSEPDDPMVILNASAVEANRENRRVLREEMETLGGDFHRHRPFVIVAIIMAFLGGTLGFVGVTFLHG
jgi:hypothetical protein